MPITVADAEGEKAQVDSELEALRTQIKTLSAREAELAQASAGWQAIIFAKRRQGSGEGPNPIVEEVELPSDASVVMRGENEEADNRTQFVRDQIRANAAAGMTVLGLKKAAAVAGMSHPPSWPYGPLSRLKKKGEIIKRKGRFYPNPKAVVFSLSQ